MIVADLELLRLELFLRMRNDNQIVWKTKKGNIIPINQMTDSHLVNTIKMLERDNIEDAEAYEALSSIGDKDF